MAGQSPHCAAPGALASPTGQAVHGGLPLGPKKPALHVQAADPGERLLEPEGHLRRKRRRPEREKKEKEAPSV